MSGFTRVLFQRTIYYAKRELKGIRGECNCTIAFTPLLLSTLTILQTKDLETPRYFAILACVYPSSNAVIIAFLVTTVSVVIHKQKRVLFATISLVSIPAQEHNVNEIREIFNFSEPMF